MQLQEHADPTVAQAGEEPEFPQRARAVELALIESGGQLEEFGIASRGIDRGLMDVVTNVESIVVDPERAASQNPRNVEAPPQLRDARQAPPGAVRELVEAQPARLVHEGCAVDHGQAGEVARPLRTLEAQEHEVQGR